MKRLLPILAVLLLPTAAGAQALYKCTDPKGRVTYQEVPCPLEKVQRKVDTSHAGQGDATRAADEMIERRVSEAVEESNQRARRERLDRLEREQLEKLRREREKTAIDEPWNPPWGFPAKPGLARKPSPTDPSKPDTGSK
jgi:hypothetical protein